LVSTTTDQEARQGILQAWGDVITGRYPTWPEVYAIQVTGRAESGYGTGWHSPPHAPDCVGSHNWGAIQCAEHSAQFYEVLGKGPREDFTLENHAVPSAVAGHCFLGLDSSPEQGWYVHPYRIYPSHREGCASVIAILERMGVLAAVREIPTYWRCAEAQYDAGYFEGFDKTREANIRSREQQFMRHGDAIFEACGDPAPGLTHDSPLVTGAVEAQKASVASPNLDVVGTLALLGVRMLLPKR
jgi:hypothetical protein